MLFFVRVGVALVFVAIFFCKSPVCYTAAELTAMFCWQLGDGKLDERERIAAPLD
jgi:hypothetical protein